ncbi:Interferon-induced protein with tetratricopeptide repeats 2, partial [Galemys pyrenaicus]
CNNKDVLWTCPGSLTLLRFAASRTWPGLGSWHNNGTRTNSLERSLQQLKCHFTWKLVEREKPLDYFEDRVCNQIEFQNNEFKATMCNLLAYIKSCRGQNEEALECLQQAEEFIQHTHAHQAERRSLVTWGNYAWVYYRLGRLSEAQTYVDKVKQVCEKFSNPYSIECPKLYSEEGWTRLMCGEKQNERAMVCFQKALERKPGNPEFTTGFAIAASRLEDKRLYNNPIEPLKQAIRLNPDNQYLKVLLALKLQSMNEEHEGERLIEEALEKAPCATDVIRLASKFYRCKGDLDKTMELLEKVLEYTPNNSHIHFHMGYCYREKIFDMKNMGIHQSLGKKEKFQELIRQAVYHLKIAEESHGNYYCVYSTLATLYTIAGQYKEAECYFQKEFNLELHPIVKQRLHLRYGNFQLYQMKCEHKAIHHYMEGVKIKQQSSEKEKMKNKLQKIARNRLSVNGADPQALSLLAFLQEQGGEMQPAGTHHSDHVYFLHSEDKSCLEKVLSQLKCHFTWNLFHENTISNDLDIGVVDQINNLDTEYKATMCNLLAYIKHCRGQNEEALECLQQAEEFIQHTHAHQAERRSLVTWGNYAWVYYRLGRLSEAQTYVDKVKQVCEKFSDPYSIECPEVYSEEGWTRLKCGDKQIERAIKCFEKALERSPGNPEFTSGLAIETYHLDESLPCGKLISLLHEAIRLNPNNQYLKVLLALKLQSVNKEDEGERLVEEALENAPCDVSVFRQAAKFYRSKGDVDKAIPLFKKALEHSPNKSHLHFYIGSCYRTKALQKVPHRNRMSDEEKQEFEELIEQGVDHLKRANEISSNHTTPCLYIADLYILRDDFERAEVYFQEDFTKDLTPIGKQKLHLHYGNFQLHQMKCEHKAIHHYMEGVKINKQSNEKEKMKKTLQKIARNRLSVNGADPQALSLLAFLQEQGREMQPAGDNSESDLASGSLNPSASLN